MRLKTKVELLIQITFSEVRAPYFQCVCAVENKSIRQTINIQLSLLLLEVYSGLFACIFTVIFDFSPKLAIVHLASATTS